MMLRSTIRVLLMLVLGLPLLHATLMWVTGLLAAMADEAAAGILGHLNTAVGVVWLLTLVGLVVALAIQSLNQRPPPST